MNLQNLILLKKLYEDEIFNPDGEDFQKAAKLVEKAEKLGLSGNIFRAYLIYFLAHEKNLISETVEITGGKIGESLREIFRRDIESLLKNFSGEICDPAFDFLREYIPTEKNKIESLDELDKRLENVSDAGEIADIFIEHYKKFGYGDIAACRAFRWDEGKKNIVGIRHFEKISLEDLIGYEHQKELLTKNTIAFLANKPANNVLLVGARGTGKSSGVKALVNEYYSKGLRLVQITKPQLINLFEIMHTLRKLPSRHFIIFLDDLSFEEDEPEYKFLKSSIEGGVESKPKNVLIYATSNRRHLIRETWRDRVDEREELYRNDSVNETISLSDRFGLIIRYDAPSQKEYLAIIRHMLKKNGIELDEETLRVESVRWEMTHSGRNGRTAKQFVDNYLGQQNL